MWRWVFVLTLVGAEWIETNVDSSLQTDGVSCAYSIGLDTYRSCSNRCGRALGVAKRSWQFWFTSIQDLGSVNGICSVPRGYRSLPPLISQQTDLWDYAIPATENFTKFSYMDTQISDVNSYRVSRKLVRFDKEQLRRLALDPLRLTYAAIRVTNRAYQERQCSYLHFLRRLSPELVAVVGDKNLASQTVFGGTYWGHESTRGYMVGRKIFEDPFLVDSLDKGSVEVPNRYVYLQPITAALQQQLLRVTAADLLPDNGNGDDETTTPLEPNVKSEIGIGLTRSYDMNAEGDDIEGEVVVDSKTYDDSGSDTRYALEMFSTMSWNTKAAPECAERRDCSSCTVHARCAWCDMSQVDSANRLVESAGWHSQVGSVDPYGSGCGVPPLICGMMGGTPFVNKCRATY